MSASVGNDLSHHTPPIQQFHTSRLAQSYVTVANQIVYAQIATQHTETYRESLDPSFPVRDTESDPCWGWLGLACETVLLGVCFTHNCV